MYFGWSSFSLCYVVGEKDGCTLDRYFVCGHPNEIVVTVVQLVSPEVDGSVDTHSLGRFGGTKHASTCSGPFLTSTVSARTYGSISTVTELKG